MGLSIPVRAAKAKLSALLELVAGGQEVTITSRWQAKGGVVAGGKTRAPKSVYRNMGTSEENAPVARRADRRGNYP